MGDYVISLDKQFIIQLFIQLLNTIIMCAGLSFILYKPVLNFLNARKEKVAKQIDDAQFKVEEAEKYKLEYENKLKEIDVQRNDILEKARLRASQREQQIITEAKKEAEALKLRAMTDIQREQEKAKDEMRKQIIEVSSVMASRFISVSINENEKNKIADEVISDLEEIKWQN